MATSSTGARSARTAPRARLGRPARAPRRAAVMRTSSVAAMCANESVPMRTRSVSARWSSIHTLITAP